MWKLTERIILRLIQLDEDKKSILWHELKERCHFESANSATQVRNSARFWKSCNYD